MISAFAEEQTNLTDLKILDLNGNVLNQQFVDGKIQSLAVSETGDLFLLKRLQGEESIIYKWVTNIKHTVVILSSTLGINDG